MRKGQINKIIDALLHPYFKDKRVVLLDGVVHAIVERNLPKSVEKFVRYNLKELLK